MMVIFSASILSTAAAAKAPAASPFSAVPVVGTIANSGGTFSGTLNVTRVTNQNGNLAATGTLTGTLTYALGNVIGTVTNLLVKLAVTPGNSTCDILSLQLGPLDLNLLGMVVHLDQVNLDITAQSGSGNLLGNLLCAGAHLLDGGGAAGAIAGLLNNILRILG